MKRQRFTFILLLIIALCWAGQAASAAPASTTRYGGTAANGHPQAPVNLASPIHTLLDDSILQDLAACTPSPSVTRIMPLGDSITKGVYGSDYPETRPDAEIAGYRLPLYVDLRNSGYSVDFVGGEAAGNAYSGFDVNHEGHPGWRDSQIAANVYNWLTNTPARIILLHIGTNSLNSNPADVEDILDEIKRYKQDNPGTQITTVVARIIDRIPRHPTTTAFNDNVVAMIHGRDDKNTIVVVDMENGAGIVYDFSHNGGDMADNLHPYATGYEKMANQWLTTLGGLGLTRCLLPPLIHARLTTTAYVNQPFKYQVLASGRPSPTFELISYPQGMTINANTGVIRWLPGATGTFNFSVRATNSQGSDQKSFTVAVTNTPAAPVITPVPNQNAATGLLFTYHVEAPGNPAPTFSLPQKPAGMAINAATGVISWTPAATGSFNVTVRAANSQGADQKSFTITVTEGFRLFLPLAIGN